MLLNSFSVPNSSLTLGGNFTGDMPTTLTLSPIRNLLLITRLGAGGEVYETLLAIPSKLGMRLRESALQEQHTELFYAKDADGNPVQIPNPYPGAAHRRKYGKSDQTAGRWHAAIRKAESLQASLLLGTEACRELLGASLS